MFLRIVTGACGTICALTLPSVAADPSALGYVHIGGAYMERADDATLYMGGAAIPGAAFSTEGQFTLGAEAGLFLSEGIALAISGIVPVTTPNIAAGTLAGLGNLGDETVGFYSATAQYHFGFNDILRPILAAASAICMSSTRKTAPSPIWMSSRHLAA